MKVCKECGASLLDEAMFCSNCGTPVDADDFEATGILYEDDNESLNLIENENFELTGVLYDDEENVNFAIDNVESENTGILDLYNTNNEQGNNASTAYSPAPAVPNAYVNPGYKGVQNYASNNQPQQNAYSNPAFNSSAQNGYSSNQQYYQTNQYNTAEKQTNLIDCYKKFWQNYANFSGRARRSEYWYVVLANIVILITASILELLPIPFIGMIISGLYLLYAIATIVPNLSLIVRRLHDIGKEWYYIFFGLIPFAGAIILLVWIFQDSQPGTNAFGENPKGISA